MYTYTVSHQMHWVNSFSVLSKYLLFCVRGHVQQGISGGIQDSNFACVGRAFVPQVGINANKRFRLVTFSPRLLV